MATEYKSAVSKLYDLNQKLLKESPDEYIPALNLRVALSSIENVRDVVGLAQEIKQPDFLERIAVEVPLAEKVYDIITKFVNRDAEKISYAFNKLLEKGFLKRPMAVEWAQYLDIALTSLSEIYDVLPQIKEAFATAPPEQINDALRRLLANEEFSGKYIPTTKTYLDEIGDATYSERLINMSMFPEKPVQAQAAEAVAEVEEGAARGGGGGVPPPPPPKKEISREERLEKIDKALKAQAPAAAAVAAVQAIPSKYEPFMAYHKAIGTKWAEANRLWGIRKAELAAAAEKAQLEYDRRVREEKIQKERQETINHYIPYIKEYLRNNPDPSIPEDWATRFSNEIILARAAHRIETPVRMSGREIERVLAEAEPRKAQAVGSEFVKLVKAKLAKERGAAGGGGR